MKTSISVQGKQVWVTPTGFKLGSKGKVTPTGEFLGSLSKGEARKLRKEMFKMGQKSKASAKRLAS